MTDKAQVVAIIPARGGSKGIPGKNLQLLGDKPLIAWSIEAARRCAGIDRVVVSTDDKEIAAVARDLGAEVPFLRPPELSRDDSCIGDAFAHALAQLESAGATIAGWIELYPTHPFRTPDMLDQAVASIRAGCRAFQTVRPVQIHRWSYVAKRQDGTLAPISPALRGLALGVHCRPYGLVQAYARCPSDYSLRTYPVTDPVLLTDIDTVEDLERARLIVKKRQRPGGMIPPVPPQLRGCSTGKSPYCSPLIGDSKGDHPLWRVQGGALPEGRGEAEPPRLLVAKAGGLDGFEAVRLTAEEARGWSEGEDGSFLPSGVTAGLKRLLGQGLAPGACCMVLDPRGRRVTRDMAGKLLEKWRGKPDVVWTTVAAPEDHPCQLQARYATAGIGCVHLFDRQAEATVGPEIAGAFHVTRPFRYFPGRTDAPAGFPPLVDMRGAGPEGFWRRLADKGNPLALRQGEGEARLLFSRAALDRAMAGIGRAEPLGLSLFHDSFDARLLVYRTEETEGVWARFLGAPPRDVATVFVPDGTGSCPLRYRAKEPFQLPDLPAGPVLFFSLASLIGNGGDGRAVETCDAVLPFQHDLSLWRYRDGIAIRCDTGAPIVGRQWYPECFEVDGRLTVGTAEALASAGRLVKGLEVEPAAIPLAFRPDAAGEERQCRTGSELSSQERSAMPDAALPADEGTSPRSVSEALAALGRLRARHGERLQRRRFLGMLETLAADYGTASLRELLPVYRLAGSAATGEKDDAVEACVRILEAAGEHDAALEASELLLARDPAHPLALRLVERACAAGAPAAKAGLLRSRYAAPRARRVVEYDGSQFLNATQVADDTVALLTLTLPHRVVLFRENEGFFKEWEVPFEPRTCFAGSGGIWLCDFGGDAIHEYDMDGRFLRTVRLDGLCGKGVRVQPGFGASLGDRVLLSVQTSAGAALLSLRLGAPSGPECSVLKSSWEYLFGRVCFVGGKLLLMKPYPRSVDVFALNEAGALVRERSAPMDDVPIHMASHGGFRYVTTRNHIFKLTSDFDPVLRLDNHALGLGDWPYLAVTGSAEPTLWAVCPYGTAIHGLRLTPEESRTGEAVSLEPAIRSGRGQTSREARS